MNCVFRVFKILLTRLGKENKMDDDNDSDLTSLTWLLSSNVMQPHVATSESPSTSGSTSCNLPIPKSKLASKTSSTATSNGENLFINCM